MGYLLAMSPCVGCKRTFMYHPHKVPSVKRDGVRQPICEDCMGRVNAVRKERGLEPLAILPGAYDPAEESEL